MSKAVSKKLIQQTYADKECMDVILSTLNTGLVLLDRNMTVVWANAMIKKMFPDEDLHGKKCYAVAENRTGPCKGCQAVHAFKDGNIHEREFQNSLNGRWYSVIALPIKDKTGKVINVLEATTDIDDRKKVEQARDQAIAELSKLKRRLQKENTYLKSWIREVRLGSDMIGSSNALRYVQTRIIQVAPTEASVLIMGETGVGKELVASAIHDNSRRAANPFIKVNCAAISGHLVASELFGHERGAYTDAVQRKEGRFELADTGTLLLDEISELPPDAQAKLLRILQDGEFERVGGTKTLKADVRILAATNRDLCAEVSQGRFRADLYYRLNVFPITVPPLRNRREDIPLLVQYFVPRLAARIGITIEEIPVSLMERLEAYDWPGNVRELKNILERAVITSKNKVLSLAEGFDGRNRPRHDSPRHFEYLSLEAVERQHLLSVLESKNWRISGSDGAAKVLGLNPSTLRFRIKKLGLDQNGKASHSSSEQENCTPEPG